MIQDDKFHDCQIKMDAGPPLTVKGKFAFEKFGYTFFLYEKIYKKKRMRPFAFQWYIAEESTGACVRGADLQVKAILKAKEALNQMGEARISSRIKKILKDNPNWRTE